MEKPVSGQEESMLVRATSSQLWFPIDLLAQCKPNQNPNKLFFGTDKLILKFTWRGQIQNRQHNIN